MKHCSKHVVSRRDFLRTATAAAAGLLVAGCQPKPAQQGEQPTRQVKSDRPQVAIAQATEYEDKLIQKQVRDLLDKVGGLGDVVRSGDRVAIKVNLTGGIQSKPLPSVSAIESYITHPSVVQALIGFVRDAGAKEVFIVEAVYEWESYKEWGYEEVAQATGAKLIDLNQTAPYTDFANTSTGEKPLVYPTLRFNHLLEEVDAFMSVSKLKCHWSCGVTHTMKNLVGLVPMRFYALAPQDTYRSAFHGTEEEMGTRLPGVVMDLNRARPIHFGLIDGIKTAEAGEGPWIGTMAPVQANVLIAGKDPVATDAVATAVMGFDPTTDMPNAPFLRSKNHLNMAHELGIGTNRLDEIVVLGSSIDDVKTQFKPCWQ